MPVARKTNLRMEAGAGRAEVIAEYIRAEPGHPGGPLFSGGPSGPTSALAKEHGPMLSQTISVAPEIVASGGRMELCDGLLYVQAGTMLMTAETVRGVGEEGLAIMAAARKIIDQDRPTGAFMTERQRAMQDKAQSEDWWAAPVSENMAPLGFAIFQAILSGRHKVAITGEVYTLWMKALAALKENLSVVDLRLTHQVNPGGRPLVKSSPMRATMEARSAPELELYRETARAVYTESSGDLATVLADEWPASWEGDQGYRDQLLRKNVADAVANADRLAGTQADRMRRVLGMS